MFRCRPILVALEVLLLAGFPANADDNQENEPNKIPEHARAILEKADKFELLSLQPDRPKKRSKDGFHGYPVLGKTTVKTAKTRKRLIAKFKKGIAENDGIRGKCFIPRHGIRATRGGKTADFVICFECFQVKVYVGDRNEAFLITDSPQFAFDKVLKKAKVPLAKKPKKAKRDPGGNE